MFATNNGLELRISDFGIALKASVHAEGYLSVSFSLFILAELPR